MFCGSNKQKDLRKPNKFQIMEYTKQQFESIYKEHYQRMYLIAYSMLEDSESAKDIVNQVFTEIWYKKPEIRNEAIRIYLLSATKNQCTSANSSRRAASSETNRFVTYSSSSSICLFRLSNACRH